MDKAPRLGKSHGVRLSPLGRLAWLPIPILLIAIVVFWVADLQGSHESVYVLLILNIHCVTLVCLFIACLIARSFLAHATPGLLLLGCGVVIWGPAGVVATAVARGDANLSIMIYNCCVWLSSLCHLAGTALSLRRTRSLHPPNLWLSVGYVLAGGAVALVVLSALAGWIPTFFIENRGGTPVRQAVLYSAMGMFLLAAVLLRATHRRSTSTFVYWYTLALTLIAVGLFGVVIQTHHASILGWTGRATQSLGGLYMLIAAVASVRESRIWEVSLEAALDESEKRYRLLSETTPDAIVVHKDGRFLYVNNAALALLGADSFEQMARHTVLDFFRPQDRQQADERTRLAMRGNRLPIREATLLRLDGQELAVEFHTAPVDFQGTRAILTIIRDITERKRAQEALRELSATLETKVTQRTAELERRARQLQRLTLELSQTEDRERRRIAGLLHEDLQQYLAGVKFQLNLLRPWARTAPPLAILEEVDEMLRQTIEKSRSLCHDLSPTVLQMNDLSEVLRLLARQAQSKHGLTVQVDVPSETILRSETLAMFIFGVAQEILFNVVKHAGVNQATLRLHRRRGRLRLVVADKGRGFDPKTLAETTGFGLLSIRERIGLLGGRMKIHGVQGRGSTVLIMIPDNGIAGEGQAAGNTDRFVPDPRA